MGTSQTKSKEVGINIRMCDIHEIKKYLGDKSFKEVLHSIRSEKNASFLSIKHIAKCWTRNINTGAYELIV